MVLISYYDFETNSISRTSNIETQLTRPIIISKEITGNICKSCNRVAHFRRLTAIDIFTEDTDQN
jgi:hypothetical protein